MSLRRQPEFDPDAVLLWVLRWYCRRTGRPVPAEVRVRFPGERLVVRGEPDRTGAERAVVRPAGLWEFCGRWAEYGGTGDRFELLGQVRQLLEVLAAAEGRAVPDGAILADAAIPPARLRAVASNLRAVLQGELSLAGDAVVREGGGYRLTVT